MIKRTVLAAAIGALTATAALAQDVPASVDDCLKQVYDLAQSAEGKKLSNDRLDKLEALLTKMEGHCDAKQFNEAAGLAKDIKAEIGG